MMSRRRREVTPAEAAMWRASTQDVAPLPGRHPGDPPDAPPPPMVAEPPRPARPHAPPPPVLRQPPPPLRHGTSAGVDKRTAERLRRGQMDIDGRLDLHGYTQDAAHAALRSYVISGYEQGRRCLLIITGKGWREGTGVLRANVPRWLNEPGLRERVLSFSHAQPQHGGEGALYVLLKRKR